MQDERNGPAATFADLGLNETLVNALANAGYDQPTDLQRAMVRPILEGHDIIAQARRGQGKTLGYLLPILNQIDLEGPAQVLVVSPTRELAIQISTESRKLLGQQGLRSLALHPGTDAEQQAGLLEKDAQVISGTPGRLLDMIERGALNARAVKFVVFDELDRLLNSGHLEPMRRIMHDLAHGRQLVWVAASIDEEIQFLADKYLVHPKRVAYEEPEQRLAASVHELVLAPQRQQVEALVERIREVQPAAAIVITSRRDDARKMAEALHKADLSVMNMDEEASKLSRRGRSERSHPPAKPGRQESVVWVASEMVTRAIDLPHVGLLAHFGPPSGVEAYADYVCRLVRLGAKLQRVVTLVEPGQRSRLEELYSAVGIEAEIREIEAAEGEPEQLDETFERGDRDRDRGDRDRDRSRGRDRDRGGRDRDRGGRDRDRGRGRDRGDRERGDRERGDRERRPDEPAADGAYRSAAEIAAATAPEPARPAEQKSSIAARLEQAKAAGYVTDTSSREYPVIPLRYVLPVTAKRGKGGLPDYPPRKTLGSKFRTARRGSRRAAEEE